MSLSQLCENSGKVETICRAVEYVNDPLLLYQSLSQPGRHSVLLESAEIECKSYLKSLMIIDACVRFECRGHSVECVALNRNGYPVLQVIAEYCKEEIVNQSQNELVLSFPVPDSHLDEDARLRAKSVFDALRAVIVRITSIRGDDNAVFLGGVFAYDLIASFEQLPEVPEGYNQCPDFVFYLSETLLIVDHKLKTSEIMTAVFSGEHVQSEYFRLSQRLDQLITLLSRGRVEVRESSHSSSVKVSVDKSDESYCADVLSLKERILAGDIFQVVPSRTFSLPCECPFKAYKQLKHNNPSPYMFMLNDVDFCIFGASPESAIKYTKETCEVEIYPIAGTRTRGFGHDGAIDPDLDSRIELELRADEKEKSEHVMLVDLARNDLARVCEAGTRYVKALMQVDRYSQVMHLVSKVVGQLRSDLDALHAYQACLNMGTLVGAPKVRAAELIRKVEGRRRGSYGGAVGYLNGKGDFDTCIVIRSAFVSHGIAHVQAGAGVVHDSVPQSEADETRSKARAVINAIKQAQEC